MPSKYKYRIYVMNPFTGFDYDYRDFLNLNAIADFFEIDIFSVKRYYRGHMRHDLMKTHILFYTRIVKL